MPLPCFIWSQFVTAFLLLLAVPPVEAAAVLQLMDRWVGTSYITGKYLIERLMTEWAEQLEEQGQPFVMKDFFQEFNDTGNIPVELVRWQMTGNKPNYNQ